MSAAGMACVSGLPTRALMRKRTPSPRSPKYLRVPPAALCTFAVQGGEVFGSLRAPATISETWFTLMRPLRVAGMSNRRRFTSCLICWNEASALQPNDTVAVLKGEYETKT